MHYRFTNDGYHDGSMLKGFVDCEKFGKMWECNLIGI